jgi:enolase
MATIAAVRAREILDSRGEPTLEVDVLLDDGTRGRAGVPSGASRGSREAHELRDGDPQRYAGRGCLHAVARVHEVVAPALIGMELTDPGSVDERLRALDPTPRKGNLGANVTLGVSLAAARAAALAAGTPLYQFLSRIKRRILPVPYFNVLNGGVHTSGTLDFEDYLLIPAGARTFADALRMGSEAYHALGALLRKRGHGLGVGDEGGFQPGLRNTREAFEVLMQAIAHAGLRPGVDIGLGLDVSATALRDASGRYSLRNSGGGILEASELIETYRSWVRDFPLWSIEDALAEDDWAGWRQISTQLGDEVQLVADDLLTTSPLLTSAAVKEGIANCVLIKLNQVGTLTEAVASIRLATEGGYRTMVSHRSGETTDDFIADLAVASGVEQIKAGAPARGERVAKYNQLLRIEAELGSMSVYAGREALGKFKRLDAEVQPALSWPMTH